MAGMCVLAVQGCAGALAAISRVADSAAVPNLEVSEGAATKVKRPATSV